MDEISEVWCYKCDLPSVREIAIRRGSAAPEKVGACGDHLWLLIHPRGLGRRDAKGAAR